MVASRSLAGSVAAALAVMVSTAGAADGAPVVIVPDGPGIVPWQVALIPSTATSLQNEIMCGGTIRDALHVVTAAHCVGDPGTVAPTDLDVAAAFTDQARPQTTLQRRHVAAISTHPAFNTPAALDNDAAILTLDQPLDLADPTIVAALPPAGLADTGTQALISGWGDTNPGDPFVTPDRLQEAVVDVLADTACGRYGDAYDPALMICAGRLLPNGTAVDTCQGDSGGPLARLAGTAPNSADRLLGIVSFGNGCGNASFPGIYTRVSAPSINAFVTTPAPVGRPQPAGAPTITGTADAGGNVRCLAGTWTGDPALSFEFERTAAGGDRPDLLPREVVQARSPSDTYRLADADVGALIACTVRAVNAGGSATTFSARYGPVAAARIGDPGAPGGVVAPAVLAPRAPRPDSTAPTAQFTTRHCTAARCDLLLFVADDRNLAGVAVRTTVTRLTGCPAGARGRRCRHARPLRAHRAGAGRFTVAARGLRPGRYRFTARAVDAAGNRQAVPVSVVLRISRR